MESIKEHLSKVKDTIYEWGNIPFAHDSDDLEALDKRSDAWWEELKADVRELEKAIFGASDII
jgi:hypothetical protein